MDFPARQLLGTLALQRRGETLGRGLAGCASHTSGRPWGFCSQASSRGTPRGASAAAPAWGVWRTDAQQGTLPSVAKQHRFFNTLEHPMYWNRKKRQFHPCVTVPQ